MSDNRPITIPSSHSVGETIDRLTDAPSAAGLRIFPRIDHRLGRRHRLSPSSGARDATIAGGLASLAMAAASPRP